MTPRLFALFFLALLLALLAQLQFGQAKVSEVAQLRQKVAQQRESNAQAQLRVDQLESEVLDLRDGLDTVEEKARHDLGMVKPGEILVRFDRH